LTHDEVLFIASQWFLQGHPHWTFFAALTQQVKKNLFTLENM